MEEKMQQIIIGLSIGIVIGHILSYFFIDRPKKKRFNESLKRLNESLKEKPNEN